MDLMFDTSAYGEYESCNSPHLGQSLPRDDDDDDDEGGEEDDGWLLDLERNGVCHRVI